MADNKISHRSKSLITREKCKLINFPGTNINCKLLFKRLEATEIPLLESNHSLKGGRRRGRKRYRSVQQVVARRTGRNYGAENDKWRSTTKFYSTHIPEENSISLYIDAWISSRYRSLCIDTRVFVRSFVCLFTYLFIYLRDRSSRCNKLKHRHQSRLLVSLSSSSFFLPAGNLFNDDACAR